MKDTLKETKEGETRIYCRNQVKKRKMIAWIKVVVVVVIKIMRF